MSGSRRLDAPDAITAFVELARLLTEIEMLGLGADDSQAVRRAVAAAFAESVADPEFGTDAVLAAVGASGIGLPVPL